MTLAWESGAVPVIVLTKADLVDDPAPAMPRVEAVAYGVPVVADLDATGVGLDDVRGYLPPG